MLQFDADKRRPIVLIGFFRIFKSGNIVIRPQHLIQKFAKRTCTLREADHKIMLVPFIDKGTFLDFLHPVNVVIAAADDANHIFACDLIP
ncbi:hypothetical protein D3C85_1761280 [compost metagenome]